MHAAGSWWWDPCASRRRSRGRNTTSNPCRGGHGVGTVWSWAPHGGQCGSHSSPLGTRCQAVVQHHVGNIGHGGMAAVSTVGTCRHLGHHCLRSPHVLCGGLPQPAPLSRYASRPAVCGRPAMLPQVAFDSRVAPSSFWHPRARGGSYVSVAVVYGETCTPAFARPPSPSPSPLAEGSSRSITCWQNSLEGGQAMVGGALLKRVHVNFGEALGGVCHILYV